MSRVLTVLGNVRYFHLVKVSNMVQMVTMVAPLKNVSNANGKREVVKILCQGHLNTWFLSSSLAHLLHGGGTLP